MWWGEFRKLSGREGMKGIFALCTPPSIQRNETTINASLKAMNFRGTIPQGMQIRKKHKNVSRKISYYPSNQNLNAFTFNIMIIADYPTWL